MVDELFVSLHEFSLVLLPILGVLVLVYLVALLRKIISVFSRVDALLTSVDHKVAKLDGPLDSLVRLSRSVDMMHDATLKGVHGLFQYAVSHWSVVSDWFQELIHKSNDEESTDPVGETESILKSKGDA